MHHGKAKINENIFISLMPHNLLMQIESSNNILHITYFNIVIEFIIEFGCVGNGEMFDDVK
jgi:hypothetical protein